MICEGECDKHEGKVKRVNIKCPSSGRDWGEYIYCERAIKEDIKRGFKIKEI